MKDLQDRKSSLKIHFLPMLSIGNLEIDGWGQGEKGRVMPLVVPG